MTQFAVEGATMTETIILEKVVGKDVEFDKRLDKAKSTLGLIGPNITKCLIPTEIEEDGKESFDFMKDSGGQYKNVTLENDNIYPENRKNEDIAITEKSVIDGQSERREFFRYVCISAPSGMKHLNAQIVVGHILSKGKITAKNDVKDYVYSIIIPL
jgi:hypothetical protein